VGAWLRGLFVRGDKGELYGSGKAVHISKTRLFDKAITFVDMPSQLDIKDVDKVKLDG